MSAALESLDRQLARREAFYTLEPGRTRARLPGQLCARLLRPDDPASLVEAFTQGLARTVRAMLVAFPDNVLWDLEGLAQAQLAQARAHPDPAAEVRVLWNRVAQLQHRFGVGGPIRFRYIHDFVYGFDWARWVAQDAPARATVGPYDATFVERMHRRGAELVALIEAGDDDTYRPLPDARARNPFGFSREPAQELALHRELAASGALPVRAWSSATAADWRRPYGQMRKDAAQALRVAPEPGGAKFTAQAEGAGRSPTHPEPA